MRQVTHKLNDNETAKGSGLVELLRVLLSRGDELNKWPSDDLVKQQAPNTPIYTQARSQWARSLLERLNRARFDNPKLAPTYLAPDKYTIEHIMPQDLTGDWHHDLQEWGVENPAALHQSKLHVLGNLTLTPINPELSNKRLTSKVQLIQDDTLKLNKDLKDIESWPGARIDERSRMLASEVVGMLMKPMTQEEIGQSIFSKEQVPAEEGEESEEDED